MPKVRGMQITTNTIIKKNYKGSVKRLFSTENAYSFMSSVKLITAYSKQFFFEVLAMMKQLEMPIHF